MTAPDAPPPGPGPGGGELRRTIGVAGAAFMGLGSILGTGVFVSLGVVAGVAGAHAVLAVALAALVAACNGLSSAALAAAHPVSGGTYEYGHRLLGPRSGFTAGWMFLCAKSASAATAALGLAGYALELAGRAPARGERVVLGLAGLLALTALVQGGLRRSDRANTAIVTVTLLALGAFVAAGLPAALARGGEHLAPLLAPGAADVPGLLHGAALAFVAFTGYGRIATLGEEVRDPRRTIPRAVVLALALTTAVYLAVVVVATGAVGAPGFAAATGGTAAPLEVLARGFGAPGVAWLVAIGAVTAMAGVLLNLLLGLSRVLLAMARRREVPGWLERVDPGSASPRRAVLAVAALVGGLVLPGDVRATWSFSAFTVLVYYAITNLAALRLPPGDRLVPRVVPALGLAGCLGLAFWVEPAVWGAGLGLVGLGLAWRALAARLRAAAAARLRARAA